MQNLSEALLAIPGEVLQTTKCFHVSNCIVTFYFLSKIKSCVEAPFLNVCVNISVFKREVLFSIFKYVEEIIHLIHM